MRRNIVGNTKVAPPLFMATQEKVGSYVMGVSQTNTIKARKTIVFVHGIGASSAYFVPLAEAMSDQYNVIVLDLPGYGKTPKPPRALSIEALARVVDAYLLHHDMQDVILVGHSMGCQIIARLQRFDDKRINRSILISPTVNQAERNLWMQGCRLLQDACIEPPKANLTLAIGYCHMGIRRYLQTASFMITDTIEDSLDHTSVPTLLIRGEKDRIVPHEWLHMLGTLSPRIEIAELPNLPHGLHYTHPADVAECCRLFIE